MTGHRRRPGPLGEQAVADALTIADAMAVYLLAPGPRETGSAPLTAGTGHPGGGDRTGGNTGAGFGSGFLTGFGDLHRAEVHQAAGISSVRLDVPLPEALVRLCAHAYASDRPILDVARDIIGNRLQLPRDPASS